MLKFIITGGGSGGHVMPAISIIEQIKTRCIRENHNYEFLYLGSKESIESKQAEIHKIKFSGISTGKLRRYLSLKNIADIFRVLKGIIDSLKIINKYKPTIIVSTGGFVSVPVVIAGYFKKIPIVIHEQTIDAGLANKIASKFSNKICLTFPESKKYFPAQKVKMTGIPLREVIFTGSKESALKRFKIDLNLKTIYFTGGGLGCHILNIVSLEILSEILEQFNVIYQSGNSMEGEDFKLLENLRNNLPEYKKKRFYLFNFVNEELPDIFAVTDLAVARSGAGTVNEFLALNIPAVYIPLAIATNNEQYKNAMHIINIGGGIIIEEKDLSSQLLIKTIKDLASSERINEMKDNLKNYGNKDGASNFANVIFEEIFKKTQL